VSAVVFSAALMMIFLSNLAVLKNRAPSMAASWAGLFVFVGVNYFLPASSLLALGVPMRIAITILLVGLPIFFAGVCFSRLFSEEEQLGFGLGLNLVGAMAGGLVEYLSMVTGMRAIWGLVLVVYLLAFLGTQKNKSRALHLASG
jgi:hypothetical protein